MQTAVQKVTPVNYEGHIPDNDRCSDDKTFFTSDFTEKHQATRFAVDFEEAGGIAFIQRARISPKFWMVAYMNSY